MQLPLRQLTGNRLTLRGAHSEQRIHLGVRLDEIVVRARLNLAVTPSPALLPTLSHLQVRLNDKLLSVVPIRADHAGERIVRTIELDPRLFVDDNWLSLRLVGHYTLACEDPLHNSLWAEVDVDATGFELAIRPLALEDELALFPAPWFDRRGAGRVEVPMVLGPQPGHDRLSTASIIASWLGSLAGERGAVFPVRRDRLPNRHAIVLVSPQQPGPEGLELPEALGPTVRLMRHPKLPHVKLLVLQGRNEQELRTAALGLILGRQAMSGSTALVHELAPIPVRPPYDAPNWVATDKPVRLGELVPERAALQLQGAHPDAVRVRWRTPPDLWQGPGRSALLNLRYRTAVPAPTDNALMSLALNDMAQPRLRITVGLHEGEACIRLSHNGRRPPAEALDALAASRSQGSGGLGMGLVLCQRVMRSLQGDFRITLAPNEDTTAILHFDETATDRAETRKRGLALRLSP
ncbi:MAG: cellulose biosynthesis cyclic di-GMP-binding regulatory protein BcsB [Hydrogenophaga sp.]|uniref:cellulose biosynthesis cyclic di-GMP-binding regulatory protein BcsB n=1 Tax=Hydrogenophaga sp. TaxID=1904254 RepID=UPI0040355FA0